MYIIDLYMTMNTNYLRMHNDNLTYLAQKFSWMKFKSESHTNYDVLDNVDFFTVPVPML